MINLKKFFIILSLLINLNPAYSMLPKAEIEEEIEEEIKNELSTIFDSGQFKVISCSDSYKVLIFIRNESEVEKLEKLCFYLKKKERYSFSHLVIKGQVRDFGAVILANMLQTDKGLVSLDLSECCIGDVGARALAEAISNQIQRDKDNFFEMIKHLSFIKELKFSGGLEFKYDLAFIDSVEDPSEKKQAKEAMQKIHILKCLHELDNGENLKEYLELIKQDLNEKFMNFINENFDPNSIRYPFLLDNFKSKGKYLKFLCLDKNEIKSEGASAFFRLMEEILFFDFSLEIPNEIEPIFEEMMSKHFFIGSNRLINLIF